MAAVERYHRDNVHLVVDSHILTEVVAFADIERVHTRWTLNGGWFKFLNYDARRIAAFVQQTQASEVGKHRAVALLQTIAVLNMTKLMHEL